MKWFFVTAVVGIVVGGIVAGSMADGFEASRHAGRGVGTVIWPVGFVIGVGTLFSVSREKKLRARLSSKPCISDLYRGDRDGAA